MVLDNPHWSHGSSLPRRESSSRSNPADPLVSIVTVVRNGAQTVERTIRSVLDQSYARIEYIIIDGGSQDGTLDIIRKYSEKIAYWVSERDAGIYDAMNKGIAASTGVLINLLNADDYLERAAVERVVERFRMLQAPSILYGNAYYVDKAYSVKAEYYSFLKPWIGMTVNHQAMFVHADIYKTLGSYDSSYKIAGDYEFFLRVFYKRVPFYKIDDFLVNCRNDGVNVARGNESRREARRITKVHFGVFSAKRIFFLLYNYLWASVKLDLRSFLYRLIGVKATRKIITCYKTIRFRPAQSKGHEVTRHGS